MANYESTFSTNEFTVIDEERYNELFSLLKGDITDYTKTDDAGVTVHGFGGYGGIYSETGIDKIDDDSIGYFMDELSKILPEGQAAIYREIGNEKLNYLTAYSIIATKNDGVKTIDMLSLDEDMANAMLGKYSYTLDNGYKISASQAFKIARQTELADMKSNVLEYAADMDISDEEYDLIENNIEVFAEACNEAYISSSLSGQSDVIFETIKAKLAEFDNNSVDKKKDNDFLK